MHLSRALHWQKVSGWWDHAHTKHYLFTYFVFPISHVFVFLERNVCKNKKCGKGLCVRTQKPPFYECKCYPPYRGSGCKKGERLCLQFIKTVKLLIFNDLGYILTYLAMLASACKPNPCLNGGTCVKGRTRSSFTCQCHGNYTGRFCQVGNELLF